MALEFEHPEWMAQGACVGKPQRWFYPEMHAGPGLSNKAKELCAACPVRQQCLDYAIANAEQHGIWGGMATRERQREAVRRGQTRGPLIDIELSAKIHDHVEHLRRYGHPDWIAATAHHFGISARSVHRHHQRGRRRDAEEAA
jgi:WhiB family redox-sensing transcriptional regulator